MPLYKCSKKDLPYRMNKDEIKQRLADIQSKLNELASLIDECIIKDTKEFTEEFEAPNSLIGLREDINYWKNNNMNLYNIINEEMPA